MNPMHQNNPLVTVIESMARSRHWRLELRQKRCPDLIRAAINMRNWAMKFTIAPDARRRLKALGISPRNQVVLAKGLVQHEMAHWEVCPFDAGGKHRIVDAVSAVLRGRRGKRREKRLLGDIGVIANAVADIIVDTVKAIEDNTSDYADAQALFYIKELGGGGGICSLYNVFIRLNLMLWGRQTQHTETIANALPPTEHPAVIQEAFRLFPWRQNEGCLAAWLRNGSHWPALAKGLTRLLWPLLTSENEGTGWWRPSQFEHIQTVLYEGRSGRVKIDTEPKAGAVQQWPSTAISAKPFDLLDTPDISEIAWNRTLVRPLPNGAAAIDLQRTHVTVKTPIPSSSALGILPDLAFVVDSSGSMSYRPIEGKGEYDILLRAVFGVFGWLNDKGIASYLRYAVLNFSTRSVFSGWHPWSRRQLIHDTLFKYQGGTTNLCLNKLSSMIDASPRPFMAIMITDGEIGNPSGIARLIQSRFTAPYGFTLIQIGAESAFSRKLSTHGFHAHVIKSLADLEGLVIGRIRDRYGNGMVDAVSISY